MTIDVVGEVVIPEPSSGIFLLAGGLALLRRRATFMEWPIGFGVTQKAITKASRL